MKPTLTLIFLVVDSSNYMFVTVTVNESNMSLTISFPIGLHALFAILTDLESPSYFGRCRSLY